jgi:hypothetical protein
MSITACFTVFDIVSQACAEMLKFNHNDNRIKN